MRIVQSIPGFSWYARLGAEVEQRRAIEAAVKAANERNAADPERDFHRFMQQAREAR